MRTGLRPSSLATTALLAALAVPTAAHAGRLALGVGLGRSQAAADVESNLDASGTATLWGRYQLGRRWNASLELSRIATEDNAAAVRFGAGRLLYDLASLRAGTVVPTVSAGLGFGKVTAGYESNPFAQVDVGLGLEYRTASYLVGADFRVGSREVARTVYDAQPGVLARIPSTINNGEYRAIGLYLGMRM